MGGSEASYLPKQTACVRQNARPTDGEQSSGKHKRKLRHGAKSASRGKGRRRVPPGPGRNRLEAVSPLPPGSQGSAGPRRQTRPAGLRSPSRAAGRSWPSLGPPRAKRARLHGLGRGRPFPSPSPPWTGFGHRDERECPGRRSRSRTGSCPLSAAGGSSSLGGADSAVCQAVAAASPDSPVGGGPRETAGRHSQCPGSSRERAADGGSRRRWGRGTVS